MSEIQIKQTLISGVLELNRIKNFDDRGYFERLLDIPALKSLFANFDIQQINHSFSPLVGTLRGMHLQKPPYAETKVVSCLQGSAFDVAIDLRSDSETFGEWYGREINPFNGIAITIPPGCAHGVQILEPNTHLVYLHSNTYQPEFETGLHPLDAEIGIRWPLDISALSSKDASHDSKLKDFQKVKW